MVTCAWRSVTFAVRLNSDGTIPDLAAGEPLVSHDKVPYSDYTVSQWGGKGRRRLRLVVKGDASLLAALDGLRDGVSGTMTYHDYGTATKSIANLVLETLEAPSKYARLATGSTNQTWLFGAEWYEDSPP
jgi:hypothetical protein